MISYCTLDIEASRMVKDWSRPWEDGLSVACLWSSLDDELLIFEGNTASLDRLVKKINEHGNLVTWNGTNYDLLVLGHICPRKITARHVDLAYRVADAMKMNRVKLENVALHTLGRGKAIKMEEGIFLPENRDKLIARCSDDAIILRDLYIEAIGGRPMRAMSPEGRRWIKVDP